MKDIWEKLDSDQEITDEELKALIAQIEAALPFLEDSGLEYLHAFKAADSLHKALLQWKTFRDGQEPIETEFQNFLLKQHPDDLLRVSYDFFKEREALPDIHALRKLGCGDAWIAELVFYLKLGERPDNHRG